MTVIKAIRNIAQRIVRECDRALNISELAPLSRPTSIIETEGQSKEELLACAARELHGQRIMIFGGTGSLGRALIRRLLPQNELLVYSRDEAKHWTIRNEVNSPQLKLAVGDVRDFARVAEVTINFNPSVIIIASALKQVDTCELSPYESIQTNVLGTKNVIDAVERYRYRLSGLKTVLLISTDKACSPVNVYGMCKALAERLVTAKPDPDVRHIAVRYGNVLDSRGSILPLFRYQAEKAQALTLTHPDMTRFLMTLDDSIDLIMTAIQFARPGDIWIPKLKSMRIGDLAQIFSERFHKPVNVIGLRPGEKLHESLVGDCESPRAVNIGSHYVLKPSFASVPVERRIFSYTSADDVMGKDELEQYLIEKKLLDRESSRFEGLKIEEVRTRPVP